MVEIRWRTLAQEIVGRGKFGGGPGPRVTFRVSGQGSFVTNDFTGTYSVVGPAEVGKGQGRLRHTRVGGTYSGRAHCD